MAYEELRKTQTDLSVRLTGLRNSLFASTSLTREQLDEIPLLLLNWNKEFMSNHEKLEALKAADPAIAGRSYYNAEPISDWEIAYNEASTRFDYLLQNPTGGSGINVSSSAANQEMQRELRTLRNRIAQLEGINTRGDNRMETGEGVAERLIMELQAQRDPLRFPLFPKADAIKKYREWRNAVYNYELTNPNVDSVKLLKLRRACEGTDAASIVDLYSVGIDTFAVAMRALDERFYVARVIVSEYISTVIGVGSLATANRNNQAKQLKVILDTFKAFVKNMDAICRDSLSANGIEEPTKQQQAETTCNALYTGLLFRCLDDNMKTRLSTTLNIRANELPEFSKVLEAVERRVVAIQSSDSDKVTTTRVIAFTEKKMSFPKLGGSCVLHKGYTHSTAQCKSFLSLPLTSRGELVQKAKLCFRCLAKQYGSCDCRKKGIVCSQCGGSHHHLICSHYDKSTGDKRPDPAVASPPNTTCAATEVANAYNL